MEGWVSPRLGIRFELGVELRIIGPDGRPFATYLELAQQRDELAQQRDEAARQRDEAARQRDEERQRAERLAARLKSDGRRTGNKARASGAARWPPGATATTPGQSQGVGDEFGGRLGRPDRGDGASCTRPMIVRGPRPAQPARHFDRYDGWPGPAGTPSVDRPVGWTRGERRRIMALPKDETRTATPARERDPGPRRGRERLRRQVVEAPAGQQPRRAGRRDLPRAEQRVDAHPELRQARPAEPRPRGSAAALREDPGGGRARRRRSPAGCSAWPGPALPRPTLGDRPGPARRGGPAPDGQGPLQAPGPDRPPASRAGPRPRSTRLARSQQVLLNLIINARQA